MKDFTFLTLATDEARDNLLKCGLIYNWEKIKVSITRYNEVGTTLELRISKTLIAHNLPEKEAQTTIMKIVKKLFGEDNITTISFGHSPRHVDGKYSNWCHVQCLYVALYTDWLNHSLIMLGRRLDFIPIKGSIDNIEPNRTAIRLAQAPAPKTIVRKIQATHIAKPTTHLSQ